jgi:hypothetical protein
VPLVRVFEGKRGETGPLTRQALGSITADADGVHATSPALAMSRTTPERRR